MIRIKRKTFRQTDSMRVERVELMDRTVNM